MGERKVLNRYVPPDFDPSLLPKAKRDRSKFMEIRMMLPFSMRCNTCGEYMYAGKKFNSKKETTEERYMGIAKIRFYIKCTACSAEITFKTDPKNTDYECESGASRNFELWKDTREITEAEEKQRADEEAFDAMKVLEHKTLDNKREMDLLDALDEIKAINQRNNRVDTKDILSRLARKDEVKPVDPNALTEEDEALIKSVQFKSVPPSKADPDHTPLPPISSLSALSTLHNLSKPVAATNGLAPVVINKKKRIVEPAAEDSGKEKKLKQDTPAASGLFDYPDSD